MACEKQSEMVGIILQMYTPALLVTTAGTEEPTLTYITIIANMVGYCSAIYTFFSYCYRYLKEMLLTFEVTTRSVIFNLCTIVSNRYNCYV